MNTKTLIGFLIAGASMLSSAKEFVNNGSFEAPLNKYNWGARPKHNIISKDIAHSGKASLMVDSRPLEKSDFVIYQGISSELIGKRVNFSAWIKPTDSFSSVIFRIRQFDERYKFIGDGMFARFNKSTFASFKLNQWNHFQAFGNISKRAKYLELFIHSKNYNIPGVLEQKPFFIDDLSLTSEDKNVKEEISERESVIPKVDSKKKHMISSTPRRGAFSHIHDCFPENYWTFAPLPDKSSELPYGKINKALNDSEPVIFIRDYLELTYAMAVPTQNEISAQKTLKLYVAHGEYEPVAFSLHFPKNTCNYTTEITQCVSTNGDLLSQDDLDLRQLTTFTMPVNDETHRTIPMALERKQSYFGKPGSTNTHWLTVYAGKNVKSGKYTADILIKIRNGKNLRLPVTIYVMPFTLAETDMKFGMYLYSSLSIDSLIDMRRHGINHLASMYPIGGKVDENGKPVYDATALKTLLKNCKASGEKWHISLLMGNVNPVRNKIATIHGEKAGDAAYLAGARTMIDTIREVGFNEKEIDFIVEEEAGNSREKLMNCINAKKLKDLGLRTELICNGMWVGMDEGELFKQYLDVRTYNFIDGNVIDKVKKAGQEFRIYNVAFEKLSSGWSHNPPSMRTRLAYGFYAYKTGAKGVCQWIYTSGSSVFKKGQKEHEAYSYTFRLPKPIPSPYWECVREGIDDYRYIVTLRKLINANQGSPQAKAAAEKLERILNSIPLQIQKFYQFVTINDMSLPSLWRKEIIRHILILSNVKYENYGFDKPAAEPAIKQSTHTVEENGEFLKFMKAPSSLPAENAGIFKPIGGCKLKAETKFVLKSDEKKYWVSTSYNLSLQVVFFDFFVCCRGSRHSILHQSEKQFAP